MTYDENLSEFYLWTSSDDVCLLTLDSDITSFTVENCPDCSCEFAEENGWTSSTLVMDSESDGVEPLYMVGPWGNSWYFIDLETFS